MSQGSTKGFSLIELSIAMVVVGLMAATALQQYQIYRYTQVKSNIGPRAQVIGSAIGKFVILKGRYPCPASQFRAPGDPLYGREECPVSPTNPAVGSCTSSGGVNGVCRGLGGDDADADTNPDNVLIGAVPFADLGITMTDSLDGYARRFTYAVSEELTYVPSATGADQWVPCAAMDETCSFTGTTAVRFGSGTMYNEGNYTNSVVCSIAVFGDPNPGVPKSCSYLVPGTNFESMHRKYAVRIDTQATINKQTGVIEIAPRVNTADGSIIMDDIAIVSHGENGVGAYTNHGKMYKPCTGTGSEIENCDMDGYFIDPEGQVVLNRDSSRYNDDFIYEDVWEETNYWTYETSGSANIYNRYTNKVGIGTNEPEATLDVVGNIRADRVLVQQLCNTNGSDCFEPRKIAGTGMNVSDGLLTGFEGGEAVAAHVNAIDIGIPAFNCPVGQLATGIDASGNVSCGILP